MVFGLEAGLSKAWVGLMEPRRAFIGRGPKSFGGRIFGGEGRGATDEGWKVTCDHE